MQHRCAAREFQADRGAKQPAERSSQEASGLCTFGHREFPDAIVGLLRDLQIQSRRTAHDPGAQQAGGQNDPVANGFANKIRHFGLQIHRVPFADNPN